MRRSPQKTAMRVRNGVVQFKNRRDLSPHYRQTTQARPMVDRRPPGRGYRHLLNTKQVYAFIELLPDWEELSRGLNAVVLVPGNSSVFGSYRHGTQTGRIEICAWDEEIEQVWSPGFVNQTKEVLDRLGVEQRPTDHIDPGYNDPWVHCKFTEISARGFQLMDVFLHELGHHHDRMTSRGKRRCDRGENYAEQYAIRYASQIWDRYFKVFGW